MGGRTEPRLADAMQPLALRGVEQPVWPSQLAQQRAVASSFPPCSILFSPAREKCSVSAPVATPPSIDEGLGFPTIVRYARLRGFTKMRVPEDYVGRMAE